ncbi:MAG: CoA-binding protein [Candidatus Thorarchaeota archaeon]
MDWKVDSLTKLFNPDSIAVIGASDKPDKLGGLTLRALSSYKGKVFPVNPRISSIGGNKCYSKVTDIEQEVDLAVIALQSPLILQTMIECTEASVGSAIIFSAGFKELGPLGEKHQEQLKLLANQAMIAVIGPNCLGAGNANFDLNATFFPHPVHLGKGSVSLVSQSGGVAGMMLYAAADANLGVAKFASVGNRVNIDFHDLLRFFRQDSETDVICMFIEGTEYAREMYNTMNNVAEEKPVIVYKVGKTPVSRSAALSHTGSLAGHPALYSASIRQARGIEVSTVQEMIDTAKILKFYPDPPQGKRVAIVTHTLGPALIAAQILEEQGVSLPPPPDEISKQIQGFLGMPVDIRISNPIDLLAQGWARPEIFAKAFELVSNLDLYDAVLTVFSPNYQQDIGGGMPVEDMLRLKDEIKKPIIAVLNSPECTPPPGRSELENGGVPVFAFPERAAIALARVMDRAR